MRGNKSYFYSCNPVNSVRFWVYVYVSITLLRTIDKCRARWRGTGNDDYGAASQGRRTSRRAGIPAASPPAAPSREAVSARIFFFFFTAIPDPRDTPRERMSLWILTPSSLPHPRKISIIYQAEEKERRKLEKETRGKLARRGRGREGAGRKGQIVPVKLIVTKNARRKGN